MLDRYLVRELALPSLASAGLLLLLVLTAQAPRLAELGSARLLPLVPLMLPSLLVLLAPLALLLGYLVGLGRLGDDGELMALRAAGLGPGRLCAGPLALAAALTSAVMLLSVWVEPYALGRLRDALSDVAQRRLVEAFQPGVFNDPYDGTVLYVGARRGDTFEQIMLHDGRDPAQPRVVFARRGRLIPDRDGERLRFELEDGSVHSIARNPNQSSYDAPGETYRELRYERYSLPVDVGRMVRRHTSVLGDHLVLDLGGLRARIAAEAPGRDRAILATALHRRFALPCATLVLPLLGLGLGLRRRPGGGRQVAFGLGLAAAGGYYLLWRVGDALAEGGVVAPAAGAWLPNLAACLAGLWLLGRAARAAA